MSGKIEIAGIGACVADTLYRLEKFPPEDTKLRAVESKMAGGGPVATGLVAAAKQGCRTAFLGVLGSDAAGQFLMQDFEKYGVETAHIVSCDRQYRSFTSCIWLNDGAGSRTCVFDKGNLPAYVPDETALEVLKQAKLLMVDGNEMDAAIEGARAIRSAGGKVLYDAGGLYPEVERLLPLADILIPSAEFAKGITGAGQIEDAAKLLYRTYSPEVVVITDGKNGGVLYQGEKIIRYPAFPVKAVDSNGAGDTFHGAFAAAVVKGFSYLSCCIFASMTSALKCMGFGARESIPGYDSVIAALEREGVEVL